MRGRPADLRRRQWLGAAAACGLAWPSLARAEASPIDSALKQPILADADSRSDKGVFFGVFREAALTDLVEESQADLRFKPASAMWFTRFGSVFPQDQIRYLAALGIAAQVTWEPWGAHGEPIPLQHIVDGRWDAYIDDYGRAAAALGLPFFLRWGHEFNGDWYPWCVVNNERRPELYRQAYRRVVERMRAAGANNVRWVWCFNNDDKPAAAWNDPRRAYPGDDVVDWIGIDGYNFGTSQSWSRWLSFADVFASALRTAEAIAPRKPVLLAELGCSETGGDKAAWLAHMFADLQRLPAVRAITWFDTIKETSWALSSSEASWMAAIQGLRRPGMRGNGPALLAIGT